MIRPATRADARGIAEVHVRTWQAAYAHALPSEKLAALSIDDGAKRWERNLDEAGALVAELDDRIVGFVRQGPSRDDEGDGELYAIYVLPEAWGSGSAAALMTRALDELRAAGYEQATLWVLDDNPRARRFYEKSGWTHDGGSRPLTVLGDVEVTEVRYRIRL